MRTAIFTVWGLFWLYWLVSATQAKRGAGGGRLRLPGLLAAILAVVLLHAFNHGAAAIHSVPVQVVGVVVFVSGLALAVWARIHIGQNWGMPMTQKAEPELVTSGPYRFVRHPIYSGILLGWLGTALATNLYWLIILAVMGAYFIHSATIEERNMTATFPTTYPDYRARTKMLIPFVL